jgi:hypothetical protein
MKSNKSKPYIGGYVHLKQQLNSRYNEYINLVQYYDRFVIKRKKKRKHNTNKYEKRIDKEDNKIYVYYLSNWYEYPVTVYPITHNKQLTKYEEI